jgi:hypothetical protein
LVKYYTRHQSLKHIWYQRYNSRTNSRSDGVVPWYAKKAYKSDAWKAGCDASWNQLMNERESLYKNENVARAEIIEIESTASGSIKLWVNIDNPYAEKWDFGDVNEVVIRKNKTNLFINNYGEPRIGNMIYVTLETYTRGGNTGLSYKIKYDIKIKENNEKRGIEMNGDAKEKGVNYALDPNKLVQTVTLGCPNCNEPFSFLVNFTEPLGKLSRTCSNCGRSFTIDLSNARPWVCETCGETFGTKAESDEHSKTHENIESS